MGLLAYQGGDVLEQNAHILWLPNDFFIRMSDRFVQRSLQAPPDDAPAGNQVPNIRSLDGGGHDQEHRSGLTFLKGTVVPLYAG